MEGERIGERARARARREGVDAKLASEVERYAAFRDVLLSLIATLPAEIVLLDPVAHDAFGRIAAILPGPDRDEGSLRR